MAERDDLLRDVIANPDDDAPREAYAALCDREGDPRGEFIRVQLALARAFPADPVAEDLLRTRAERLLEAHGAEWAAPIAGLVDAYEFDRGFVARVRLSAADYVARAGAIAERAPVQHLDLYEVRAVLEPLLAVPELGVIRSLSLADEGLTDDDARVLADARTLTSLRWLSLARNALEAPGVEALMNARFMANLEYLDLIGNPFEPMQRFSFDGELVLDDWLTADAEALVARCGPLPWLARNVERTREIVPDRFRVPPL